MASPEVIAQLFAPTLRRRVLLTHMRAEVARGHLWPLVPDAANTVVLGYRNRGGTLDEAGMQFANSATWAHVLAACSQLLQVPLSDLLVAAEISAVNGEGDPRVLR